MMTRLTFYLKEPEMHILGVELHFKDGDEVVFKTPSGMRLHNCTESADLSSSLLSIAWYGGPFLQGLELTETNGTVHRVGSVGGHHERGAFQIPTASAVVGFLPCHGGHLPWHQPLVHHPKIMN